MNSNGHPTHCIDCAVKLLQEDKDEIYIGLLTAGLSVAYAAAAAQGQPHQLLLQNGYCVVSPSVTLNTDWTTFVDQCLMPQFRKCARKNLPLLANSLNQTAIYKNEDGRRWANIYPAEYERKSKDETNMFLKDIDRFTIGIAAALFPHDHYCTSAHNARQICLGEREKQMTAPLQVKKINGFARGSNLKVRQSLHVDGMELGIAVILVQKCHALGYPFHVIPKTHHLMNKHDKSAPLPSGESIRLCVKPPDFIAFAESVIHAGGESSHKSSSAASQSKNEVMIHSTKKNLDVSGWFGSGTDINKQPTDISFQLSFYHKGMPSTLDVGNGRNIWYENENCHMTDEGQKKYRKYVETGECSFVDAVSEASIRWIDLLKGGKIGRKRGRKCT